MRKFLPILCLFAMSFYAFADEIAAEAEPKEETRFRAPKHSVVSAFAQSFSSILVSEIGDKTFFIAAIMAMRYNRIAVLLGALFALLLMTILSTAFGWIVPVLLPPHITHIAITVLFFFFGVKLLYDSYHHEEGENDEQAEVEQELNQVHSKLVKTTSPPRERRETEIQYIVEDGKDTDKTKEETSLTISTDLESESTGGAQAQPVYKKDVKTNYLVSKKLVFWQALTLTFLGEWGDRSQITTIALAAEGNPLAVCVGSFLGHCLCTSLAVVGGKFLAKKISERTVNISGGILFLLFGFHNLFASEA